MKEGNCHKIVIGLLLCGLFICFGFYMKGCGDSGEKGKLLFSPASMEFSEPEVKEVLDAEEIAGLSVDYKEGVKASDIVEGINGTKEITGMSFSQDGTLVEMLREHPDEKYIYLCGAGRARLLDKNNALYMDDSEVQVKGDYYHALDYKEIGLSYKDITDKKNLVWIQAED